MKKLPRLLISRPTENGVRSHSPVSHLRKNWLSLNRAGQSLPRMTFENTFLLCVLLCRADSARGKDAGTSMSYSFLFLCCSKVWFCVLHIEFRWHKVLGPLKPILPAQCQIQGSRRYILRISSEKVSKAVGESNSSFSSRTVLLTHSLSSLSIQLPLKQTIFYMKHVRKC